jgi:hypothetical protein
LTKTVLTLIPLGREDVDDRLDEARFAGGVEVYVAVGERNAGLKERSGDGAGEQEAPQPGGSHEVLPQIVSVKGPDDFCP